MLLAHKVRTAAGFDDLAADVVLPLTEVDPSTLSQMFPSLSFVGLITCGGLWCSNSAKELDSKEANVEVD